MCVNDLIVQGAEPLFFLDYFATGALDRGVAEAIVAGIARACRDTDCALIGGETAEMPGLYAPGHYDLAGFAVGAVERGKVLPRTDDLEAGDALVGVQSSGVHSNGFSLVRRLVADKGIALNGPCPFGANTTLGEALLTPTRLYVRSLLPLARAGRIKALAHITGGGLTENVPRVLRKGLSARFDLGAWERPGVFRWLQQTGNITDDEMLRTFNCGLGLVIVVAKAEAGALVADLNAAGETAASSANSSKPPATRASPTRARCDVQLSFSSPACGGGGPRSGGGGSEEFRASCFPLRRCATPSP